MGGLQTVEDNKMLILAILVFTSTLAPSLAQNNVGGLQALVAQLVAQIQAAQNLVPGVQRSVIDPTASQKMIISDNYLGSGTQCGPRTVAGWYKICAYSRFQNSGNSVDMCIRKAGSRIACYGNAIQNDWRTTGVCTIQSLAVNDQISLYLESGGSSDCVQETSWRYNRLSIHMIMEAP